MFKASLIAGYLAAVSSAAVVPSRARADACSTSHQAGFNDNPNNHQLISGDRTRTYAVNVPDSYNENLGKEWPLIIDYHGNNGSPQAQYENSEYYKYPEGQEYIVVCKYMSLPLPWETLPADWDIQTLLE